MAKLLILNDHSLPRYFNKETIVLLNQAVEHREIDYAIRIVTSSFKVNIVLAEFLVQNYWHNYTHLDNFKQITIYHSNRLSEYRSNQMLEAIRFMFSLNQSITLAILSKFDSFH